MKTKVILHRYFIPEEFDLNSNLVFESANSKLTGEVEWAIMLPTKPEWCYTCHGTGKRSQWDIRGLDIDAMFEDDPDGEIREAYFGGQTDVECDHCRGKGVIPIVDYESITDEEKDILMRDAELYDDERVHEAECKAERRFGA